jgi:hypothetical protein
VTVPAAGEPLSFEANIKPLFRERDQKSMKNAFDLWAYDDVKTHAAAILEKVSDGSMPCDTEWPADSVELFQRWISSDFPV